MSVRVAAAFRTHSVSSLLCGTSVAIELKNVREVKIYNRDGELERALSGVGEEGKKGGESE